MFLFRSSYFVTSLPKRIGRLVRHIIFDDFGLQQPLKLKAIKYFPGILFLLLDVIAIPELYDWLTNSWKQSSRYLTKDEKECAVPIFESCIPLDEVRIDNLARIGPSQMRIVYVSFFTINSHGNYSFSTFIHELVHVWQYMNFGSIYILHALMAQQSILGYNYGGITALENAKQNNKGILSFNFEQQADIVRDYFLIMNGYKPQWSKATIQDLDTYAYFVSDMQTVFKK